MPCIRIVALAALAAASANAQEPGLRLLTLSGNNPTRIVDGQGNIVHTWPGSMGVSAHVLSDGSLLRSRRTQTITIGGSTGQLQQLAFDGTITWDVLIDGPSSHMHHDIEPMPNGNVLVIAWDYLSNADAIAAGRNPAFSPNAEWLPDSILEIQRTGPASYAVVWEWHIMDHVIQDFDASKANYGVVADHPELLDINYPPEQVNTGDWNHCNGIDYDPVHDWIVLSARKQDEIYVIDHSTTTAEAAGHAGGLRGKGGDILYRWGNPEAYRAGTIFDRQLFGQHDPRFIPPGYPGEGNLTLFNNDYIVNTSSAIFELELPLDASDNFVLDAGTGRYGPTAPVWQYTAPGFYSGFVSSSQRLQNGNTLICSGVEKRLFEVTAQGAIVWEYTHTGAGAPFQTHTIDRTLWADTDVVSIGGGAITFELRVDSSLDGYSYFLLGSLTGSSPGIPLPGGAILPLNFDVLTELMLTQFNTPVFVDTLGTIGALGEATSQMVVPPGILPTWLAGWQMSFAHMINDAAQTDIHASNAVTVTIIP